MITPGINLVMTVIGFGLSIMFIVFVCTRLICARIQLSASRRSLARANRSDLSNLERGFHGLEPLAPANFPVMKYRELCLSTREHACQRCTVCLADYHEEDTLCVLPVCGHSFHATCIGIWLQQQSTCPVCRISLRELPERKWYMQPMFSQAMRSQYRMQSVNAHYYCHCMANGNRPRSNEHVEEPSEGGAVHAGRSNSGIVHEKNRKPESPSSNQ
ncbi:hypothetical protein SASPL_128124 [Salvia splendens]|uniref:RING-type domain-containing protein n=1 Tax=Salvia splendens TaxID=180675 RepID=A0A8X8XAH2_SALSN|nr:RING-H2 finger protein ATL38-like [Salvia splendens]KAG6410076.1 hypothetical protein SASPL_128124 [Salvia splendens]